MSETMSHITAMFYFNPVICNRRCHQAFRVSDKVFKKRKVTNINRCFLWNFWGSSDAPKPPLQWPVREWLNLCHVKIPEVPVSYLNWLSEAGIVGVRYFWSLSDMFVWGSTRSDIWKTVITFDINTEAGLCIKNSRVGRNWYGMAAD